MDEKTYDEFEAEDFIANESFLNYHLGKNPADQLFWEQWLASNPGKLDTVRVARSMINALMFRLDESEYQEEFEKLTNKVDPAKNPRQSKPALIRYLYNKHDEKGSRPGVSLGRILVLPLIVVIAVSGYFLFNNVKDKAQTEITTENSGPQPMTLVLSDSTKVILASGSRLTYQKPLGNTERHVSLVGEGFFQVTKDSKRPFKVFSNGLTATVLGTEFNVKSRFGDSLVMVELLEGKVKVEAKNVGGSILLNPNERAVYARIEGNMYKEKWKPGIPSTALKVEYLVFDKNSFEEVAQKFKNVFGVTLINNSSKVNWSFTGEFNDVNAVDVIENICLLKHLAYEINGDTIALR
jgi:transmembrane sensor